MLHPEHLHEQFKYTVMSYREGEEPILPHRSQFRWFEHLVQTPPKEKENPGQAWTGSLPRGERGGRGLTGSDW